MKTENEITTNNETAIAVEPKLATGILNILKNEWVAGNGYDQLWYGYNSLIDCLFDNGIQTTLKDVKRAIKILSKERKIVLRPCYDDDNKLHGRGWFACC